MGSIHDARADFARDDLRAAKGLAISVVIGGMLWIFALALSLGVKLL
jgi:hypothetical protein